MGQYWPRATATAHVCSQEQHLISWPHHDQGCFFQLRCVLLHVHHFKTATARNQRSTRQRGAPLLSTRVPTHGDGIPSSWRQVSPKEIREQRAKELSSRVVNFATPEPHGGLVSRHKASGIPSDIHASLTTGSQLIRTVSRRGIASHSRESALQACTSAPLTPASDVCNHSSLTSPVDQSPTLRTRAYPSASTPHHRLSLKPALTWLCQVALPPASRTQSYKGRPLLHHCLHPRLLASLPWVRTLRSIYSYTPHKLADRNDSLAVPTVNTSAVGSITSVSATFTGPFPCRTSQSSSHHTCWLCFPRRRLLWLWFGTSIFTGVSPSAGSSQERAASLHLDSHNDLIRIYHVVRATRVPNFQRTRINNNNNNNNNNTFTSNGNLEIEMFTTSCVLRWVRIYLRWVRIYQRFMLKFRVGRGFPFTVPHALNMKAWPASYHDTFLCDYT